MTEHVNLGRNYSLERQIRYKQISNSIIETALKLVEAGRIAGIETIAPLVPQIGHDVQVFLKPDLNSNTIIHIQAYPGLSDADSLCLIIREMDCKKLMEIRAGAFPPSIGNEHEAVTGIIQEQTRIPNSSDSLLDLLSKKLPSVSK